MSVIGATPRGNLLSKRRRDKLWKLLRIMEYNCQISTDPEPYRVALFWLDVADRTMGWKAGR